MSGTVVVVPVAWLGIFLFKAAVGSAAASTAVGAASAAKSMLDAFVREAAEKKDEEKAKLKEWEEFKNRIQEEDTTVTTLENIIEDSEKQLRALSLDEAAACAVTDFSYQETIAAQQHQLGQYRMSQEKATTWMESLAGILKTFPASMKDEPGDPPAKLQEQMEWLRNRIQRRDLPENEEFAALHEGIRHTLQVYTEKEKQKQIVRQTLVTRMETLLDVLLFTRQIVRQARLNAPDLFSELDGLYQQLMTLCQSDSLQEGTVAFLERRIPELQQQTDQLAVVQIQRWGMAESTIRHLTSMGYAVVEDFERAESNVSMSARLRIPGGEQVRVAIHPNLQMAFEVVHERLPGKNAEEPVSVAEQTHFMRQEKRWCQDLREFTRHLIADGYEHHIRFEEHINEEFIKVVVVESADELADREESLHDDRQDRRTLD